MVNCTGGDFPTNTSYMKGLLSWGIGKDKCYQIKEQIRQLEVLSCENGSIEFKCIFKDDKVLYADSDFKSFADLNKYAEENGLAEEELVSLEENFLTSVNERKEKEQAEYNDKVQRIRDSYENKKIERNKEHEEYQNKLKTERNNRISAIKEDRTERQSVLRNRETEEKKELEERIAKYESEGTAYCPKCISTSLSANQKGFSSGKALVGKALFGNTGLLAGTLGKNKIEITCLKCGYKFIPGKK